MTFLPHIVYTAVLRLHFALQADHLFISLSLTCSYVLKKWKIVERSHLVNVFLMAHVTREDIFSSKGQNKCQHNF